MFSRHKVCMVLVHLFTSLHDTCSFIHMQNIDYLRKFADVGILAIETTNTSPLTLWSHVTEQITLCHFLITTLNCAHHHFELTRLLVTLFCNQSIRTKLNKTDIMKLCMILLYIANTILFFCTSLCKIYGQVLKWQWNKSKSKIISFQNFRKTELLHTCIKTNTNSWWKSKYSL